MLRAPSMLQVNNGNCSQTDYKSNKWKQNKTHALKHNFITATALGTSCTLSTQAHSVHDLAEQASNQQF
jgi:hypothetical protein